MGSKKYKKVDFSLCVPIANDVLLIDLIKKTEKLHRHTIEYMFDEKYWPRIESISTRYKLSHVNVFENPGFSIESGYSDLVKKSRLDWVLRLDSDEIVSKTTLNFLSNNVFQTNDVVGFLRHQVIELDDDFYTIGNDVFDPLKHIQYRFFNKKAREYGRTDIHNPGFYLDTAQVVFAPPECAIYHLDFLVRNYESRVIKSKAYDGMGQPINMREIQLGPLGTFKPLKIADQEILKFLRKNREEIKSIRNQIQHE